MNKKATKTRQVRPKLQAARQPRPLCEVRNDLRRAVDEFTSHPAVSARQCDFILMLCSLCEAPLEPGSSEIAGKDNETGFRQLALAIVFIEQYRHLLPTDFYNLFGDWTCDIQSRSKWHRDPEIISLIYPLMLRKAKAMERAKAS